MMFDISERFINYMRVVSRCMCRNNPDLADEIFQELALAVIELEITDFDYLRQMVRNRTKEYLKSKKYNYSWNNRFPYFSIDAMKEAGFQFDIDGNMYVAYDTSCDIEDGA